MGLDIQVIIAEGRTWPQIMGDLEQLFAIKSIEPCGFCAKAQGCNHRPQGDTRPHINCGFTVDKDAVRDFMSMGIAQPA